MVPTYPTCLSFVTLIDTLESTWRNFNTKRAYETTQTEAIRLLPSIYPIYLPTFSPLVSKSCLACSCRRSRFVTFTELPFLSVSINYAMVGLKVIGGSMRLDLKNANPPVHVTREIQQAMMSEYKVAISYQQPHHHRPIVIIANLNFVFRTPKSLSASPLLLSSVCYRSVQAKE